MANEVKILSIATALPPQELAQEQAFALARQFNCRTDGEQRVLQKLYKRTTIQNRRTVLSLEKTRSTYTVEGEPGTAARMAIYKTEAPSLAIEAAGEALAKAALKPEEVGNLVTVSCTGFFAPGLDVQIIERLSLSRSISRTNVGFMGCSGALNGLRAAAALTKESGRPTLLVAAELCSLHFQYGCKSDDVLANALFGDGAAAALLVPDDFVSGRSLEGSHCRLIASGSYLIEGTQEAMTWEIGDHGFQMTLDARVPDIIKTNLKPWLERWLRGQDLKLEQICTWAVHPGGPRVLDAVQEALGLEPQMLAPSREVLSRLGNMSSPTILFIVDEILRQAACEQNKKFGPMVVLAFGPGLSIESAILEISGAVK